MRIISVLKWVSWRRDWDIVFIMHMPKKVNNIKSLEVQWTALKENRRVGEVEQDRIKKLDAKGWEKS